MALITRGVVVVLVWEERHNTTNLWYIVSGDYIACVTIYTQVIYCYISLLYLFVLVLSTTLNKLMRIYTYLIKFVIFFVPLAIIDTNGLQIMYRMCPYAVV